MTPANQVRFNPRAIPTYRVQGGILQQDVPQGNNDVTSQPYYVPSAPAQPPTASALRLEPSVAQAIAATDATILMQSIHGGLISKRTPIAIGNGAYPGMELCGQIMQADEKIGVSRGNGFRMRVFVDGPRARIFSFLVLGNTKEVNSKEATRFLTSVQI